MNSKDKSLLDLYKLLWEQIKDANKPFCLCDELTWLRESVNITHREHMILVAHVKDNLPKPNQEGFCFSFDEYGSQQRKEFVQRMIKELEDL